MFTSNSSIFVIFCKVAKRFHLFEYQNNVITKLDPIRVRFATIENFCFLKCYFFKSSLKTRLVYSNLALRAN